MSSAAHQVCTKCGKRKAMTDFPLRTPTVRRKRCKACTNIYQNQHRKTTRGKDVQFRAVLKYRYGLTLDQLEQKLKAINHSCEICGISFDGSKKGTRMNIDHCHTTGKVRGILCGNCNRALGFFHDDIVCLQTAADYLRKEIS